MTSSRKGNVNVTQVNLQQGEGRTRSSIQVAVSRSGSVRANITTTTAGALAGNGITRSRVRHTDEWPVEILEPPSPDASIPSNTPHRNLRIAGSQPQRPVVFTSHVEHHPSSLPASITIPSSLPASNKISSPPPPSSLSAFDGTPMTPPRANRPGRPSPQPLIQEMAFSPFKVPDLASEFSTSPTQAQQQALPVRTILPRRSSPDEPSLYSMLHTPEAYKRKTYTTQPKAPDDRVGAVPPRRINHTDHHPPACLPTISATIKAIESSPIPISDELASQANSTQGEDIQLPSPQAIELVTTVKAVATTPVILNTPHSEQKILRLFAVLASQLVDRDRVISGQQDLPVATSEDSADARSRSFPKTSVGSSASTFATEISLTSSPTMLPTLDPYAVPVSPVLIAASTALAPIAPLSHIPPTPPPPPPPPSFSL